MRRGVRLEDPTQGRRTVTALPAELRVRGAQALNSLRERVDIALGKGSTVAPRAPGGVSRELGDDPARIAAAARARLAGGLLPGLRDVDQQYTWEAVSHRWATLYRRLVHARDAAPAVIEDEETASDAGLLPEASTR